MKIKNLKTKSKQFKKNISIKKINERKSSSNSMNNPTTGLSTTSISSK